MNAFNDSDLWDRYDTARNAADAELCAEIAGEIVEFHLGFLRRYAADTCFPYWSADVRAEYLQELVVAALEKVATYDRAHAGHGGRVAAFVTYLKPSLAPVRWKVSAAQVLIRSGVETRRLKADLERFVAERQLMGLEYPTLDQMAEHLSRLHGKKAKPIRSGQVRRLLDQPAYVWADAPAGGDDEDAAGDQWGTFGSSAGSPEDEVLAAIEEDRRTAAVRDALAEVNLSDLDKAIVAERLMAAPRRIVDGELVGFGPTTLTDLGLRFGLSPERVKRAETELIGRLRDLIDL